MSNILIIKHGSLGDIAQASGAIQDISENHNNDEVYLLTTKPYLNLFKKNKFIKDVILDKRLSRFNLIYLYTLMRVIKKYNFVKVYDLQNSKRTSFYRSILFPKSNYNIWSSSETTLPLNSTKEDFDKKSVLNRFAHQLKTSEINTKHTMIPDFSWSCSDISKIKSDYDLKRYIILFPFASKHSTLKVWPYFKELINKIIENYGDKFQIIVAPGPNEIKDAKKIKALCILDQGCALNISQLSTLIKESSFVIANDTGPAHMAAHLQVKGLALYGSHKLASLQSIERENFKAIQVTDLNKLSVDKVFEKISNSLSLSDV
tara:strand:+ start:2224 stop:3177 length:954 start_codon:yes stop_codon:yes gene_type:complete